MLLTHPLPEMLRRTASVNHAGATQQDLGFSTTSVLNQRPTEILTNELSDSRMNLRYKRRAPVPPSNGVTNGHMNGNANGDSSTIVEDEEDEGDLSRSRINSRYFQGLSTNGIGEELSASKLNLRYTKRQSAVGGRITSGVQDQIRKKQTGLTSADVHSVTSEHSDWSHWVEDVFSDALNEHDDPPSEGRSLHNRIKGGGRGIPGVQTQQVCLNFYSSLFSPFCNEACH